MGKFLGLVLSLIGLILLAVGLGLPAVLLVQSSGAILWKVLLGLFLVVGGYLMVELSGSGGLSKLIAGLIGLSGIGMLTEALLPTIIGFPLFTTGGIVLRVILGILFCVGSYAAYELGGES